MAEITNKEALKDKIHDIHNYMRNHGLGYGMTALKIFNVLYGLKKIEERGLIDVLGLKRPQCEFSYLYSIAASGDERKVTAYILKDVLDGINGSNQLCRFMFYEIPSYVKNSTYSYLMKEINEITQIEKTCNVQLSGKIYEYFVGRDETAISELGAYFTDRHIVNFILDRISPEIEPNGAVPTMIDMFGGSGGFTTGYINYLIEKYGDRINWQTELKKVFHFDINEDVIRSAALEFFCLTGVTPDLRENMRYINSFKEEYATKYKYVLTNPPYGGDKLTKSATQLKRDKVKDYLLKVIATTGAGLPARVNADRQMIEIRKQEELDIKEADASRVCLESCSDKIRNFASRHGIKGNDKEACSLMLIMDMVDIEGVAVGVLKEGVLFNKSYADLRRVLVNNYEVREIISVPQDQFENTSTKTSIVIFANTGSGTSSVKFSELSVKRIEEDKFGIIGDRVVLLENRGDICGVESVELATATLAEILASSACTLIAKDYIKREIIVGAGYSLVSIGDLCTLIGKCTLPDGEYKYVEISDINNNMLNNHKVYAKTELPNKASNRAQYGDILIACVRPKPSKIICIDQAIDNIDLYVFSSALAILRPKNIAHSQYLYSIIRILSITFERDICNGSSYPRCTPKSTLNVKIPFPNDKLLAEWLAKLTAPYNEIAEKSKLIIQLELQAKMRIEEICAGDCDEVKLGELINVKSGEYLTKANMEPGIYPVYGGGNITGYINRFNRENELIVNKDGVSLNCVKYEYGKFYLNHHGWTLEYKNTEYKKYINIWLFNNQQKIYDIAQGSAQKGINRDNFLGLSIDVPKNKQLIDNLEPLFAQIEQLHMEVKEAERLYSVLLAELSSEALPGFNATVEYIPDADVLIPPIIKKPIEIGNCELFSDAASEVAETASVAESTTSSKPAAHTVAALRELCKERKITGYSKMKKAELIKVLFG